MSISNPELNPSAKPIQRPSPAASAGSDMASIPSYDTGHGLPNFPTYSQPTIQGIPHVAKLEDITPAAGNGERLSIPAATPGENGR